MDVVPPNTLLDEVLDFVLSRPTLEEMIAYNIPSEIDAYLHVLLDKNSRDELTLDERAALDEFLRIGHLLRMLKAKARLRLSQEL